MPSRPVLKPREVVRILKGLGFEEVRQRGSHKQFRHADGRATTVPVHAGRDISPILLGSAVTKPYIPAPRTPPPVLQSGTVVPQDVWDEFNDALDKYGEELYNELHDIYAQKRKKVEPSRKAASMPNTKSKLKGKFGARVFLLGTDVACVTQTIKSGTGHSDRYIIYQSANGDQFVDLADDHALATAVRDALAGKL